MFQLQMPVELAHQLRIVAPISQDFHEQLQKYLHAKDLLEFLPRIRPDFFQRSSRAANQDSLLPLPLDVDCRANANQLVRFLKRIDKDRDGMGNFVERPRHGLLPDQFRREESFGLIGILIRGKVRLARRQVLDEFFKNAIDAISRQRGNRNYFGEIGEFPDALDDGKQTIFRDAVHFVQKQDARSFKTCRALNRMTISFADVFTHIQDQSENVNAIERGVDLSHHLAAEGGVGAVQAWRVDQHDSCIGAIYDSLNPVACGLRTRRYDLDFLSDEPVHERGFPGIRPTYYRHKPEDELRLNNQCFSN